MSHTIYAGSVSKRRNSTLQPSLTASFDVLLKSPTSLHSPTFTISAASFPYNYLKWDDRYYFVTDVTSKNNGLWEVSAVCDVLATYKSDILASTQYVCYSDQSGGTWLADTRIPVLKSASVSSNSSAIAALSDTGMYVLSVVGKDSAASYQVTLTALKDIISSISNWESNNINNINAMINAASSNDNDAICQTLATIGEAMINTGFIGNAYSQAPSCIRSCIWIPFATALHEGTDTVFLGNFDTHVQAKRLSARPNTGSTSISIPWHYADWRRAVCEEVYLYLPLVGMVHIPSNEVVGESSITIKWSYTATDGCISYEVLAGSQVIGTYGGNCAANYPIGINQQSSAGEIVQSLATGVEKTVNAAINSSISPISAAASAYGVGVEAAIGAYNTMSVAVSSHASCVGGIGGGAGSGLDLSARCFTVSHATVVAPSDMAQTMGVPTMKPLTLSTCSGYCQCANAHVAAAAELSELNEIDTFLNSGFYIE